MPMKPYRKKVGDQMVTFTCFHWRTFPPIAAFEGRSAEELRQRGSISDTDYQRHQIWERECGLLKMLDAKCSGCDHYRRVEVSFTKPPMMVTMDGKRKTPILDRTWLTYLPKYRGTNEATHRRPGAKGSKQNAAWVEQAQRAAAEAKEGDDG